MQVQRTVVRMAVLMAVTLAAAVASGQQPAPDLAGVWQGTVEAGASVLPAVNVTMADLANVLQTAVLDRPVVDRSGLQGRYDAPPSLFTAFQEQLGLKLDSTRGPVDALVVDSVQKPTEN